MFGCGGVVPICCGDDCASCGGRVSCGGRGGLVMIVLFNCGGNTWWLC